MKISGNRLQQIIKEEYKRVLREMGEEEEVPSAEEQVGYDNAENASEIGNDKEGNSDMGISLDTSENPEALQSLMDTPNKFQVLRVCMFIAHNIQRGVPMSEMSLGIGAATFDEYWGRSFEFCRTCFQIYKSREDADESVLEKAKQKFNIDDDTLNAGLNLMVEFYQNTVISQFTRMSAAHRQYIKVVDAHAAHRDEEGNLVGGKKGITANSQKFFAVLMDAITALGNGDLAGGRFESRIADFAVRNFFFYKAYNTFPGLNGYAVIDRPKKSSVARDVKTAFRESKQEIISLYNSIAESFWRCCAQIYKNCGGDISKTSEIIPQIYRKIGEIDGLEILRHGIGMDLVPKFRRNPDAISNAIENGTSAIEILKKLGGSEEFLGCLDGIIMNRAELMLQNASIGEDFSCSNAKEAISKTIEEIKSKTDYSYLKTFIPETEEEKKAHYKTEVDAKIATQFDNTLKMAERSYMIKTQRKNMQPMEALMGNDDEDGVIDYVKSCGIKLTDEEIKLICLYLMRDDKEALSRAKDSYLSRMSSDALMAKFNGQPAESLAESRKLKKLVAESVTKVLKKYLR